MFEMPTLHSTEGHQGRNQSLRKKMRKRHSDVNSEARRQVARKHIRLEKEMHNADHLPRQASDFTIFNLFLDLFIVLYEWVFSLHVCMCTTFVLGACRGKKRASNPLGLEL